MSDNIEHFHGGRRHRGWGGRRRNYGWNNWGWSKYVDPYYYWDPVVVTTTGTTDVQPTESTIAGMKTSDVTLVLFIALIVAVMYIMFRKP